MLVGGIRPHFSLFTDSKARSAQNGTGPSGNLRESPFLFRDRLGTPCSFRKRIQLRIVLAAIPVNAAMELYAEVFEAEGALDQLEGFASHFGADFYRLPRNDTTITLIQNPNPVSPRNYLWAMTTYSSLFVRVKCCAGS